ncbi:hypothetical protein QL919_06030 [Psychrobacter sp. APC 3426]|uniref:hypothetical protein n=1 Tax=Psychrobacter sp. APC 3426 TaxID=3035177 RepID=UPI0025B2E92B|nr:hypothetical protein [Psychrobacter sp. APC 3426]MDN3398284.1 hypothetical protein [Psychrobacter sp. APC 3426]
MSSIDNYQRNIQRKRKELQNLMQLKNREQLKTNTLNSKINSTSLALSKTKIVSTAKSKIRDIDRFRSQVLVIDKKIVDYEKKINSKNKQIFDEEKKLVRAQDNESKSKQKEQLSNLNEIKTTLFEHEGVHEKMTANIKTLQNLPEKINVLFLASNPIDVQQLRLDEEARSIKEMIRKTKFRDSVLFESRWAVQPMDVLQAINELNPTVVHFSGHGSDSDSDEIVFQDAEGKAKLISKEAIVQTMMASSNTIRLVFFNTCYSHNQARSVVEHVEAAIGMNTTIGDNAARIFSSQFYSAIGFGISLGKAFEQAKALLMMEGIKEENTPELFIKEGLDAYELIIVKPTELL